MGKFTETRMFLKVVSLLLAAGMYIIVTTDLFNSSGTIAAFLPQETTQEETVSDVPIVIENFDSDKYIVSGLPETVDVTFKGTSSQLKLTLNRGEYEVVANLEGVSEGSYNITFQVINIDDSVEYIVDPEEVTVTVAEKATEEFPVSLDIQGIEDLRAAGYVVTDTSLDTATAEVVGTRDAIDQIATLQADVNVADRQDSFTETADIIAYDSNGERVGSVSITPSTAVATVTIVEVGGTVASKEVPVKIETTGSAQSGIFIQSINASPEVVTIFGEENDLANTTEVTASIDLSTITENTEETVALTLPDNIRAASPSKVTLSVQLEKEETKTFSDIPIITKNLSSDLNASFVESSTATVSVTAVPTILNALSNSDIVLFIDLSGLSAGTQTVSLQAEAISNAVIDTGDQKIKVELTKKNVENGTTNDDTTEDGTTDGGTADDGTTEDGTTDDGTTEDGTTTENDTTENGTTDNTEENN